MFFSNVLQMAEDLFVPTFTIFLFMEGLGVSITSLTF